MDSTGIPNKIQLSKDTAKLLEDQDKAKWIRPRNEKIFVKGKGNMQTFWLETKEDTKDRIKANRMRKLKAKVDEDKSDAEDISEASWGEWKDSTPRTTSGMTKTERLVEWNVEILSSLLRQILACRDATDMDISELSRTETEIGEGATVLEEFKEIISLPKIGPEDLAQRRIQTK
jgi:RPA family protein